MCAIISLWSNKRGNDDLGVLGYTDHSQAHTAFVAERAAYILEELGYTGREIELAQIAGFMHDIGNHDESTGGAKDAVSAALIIADKTDVRRSRVRPQDRSNFDIHDRVNYAVTKSDISFDKEKKHCAESLRRRRNL